MSGVRRSSTTWVVTSVTYLSLFQPPRRVPWRPSAVALSVGLPALAALVLATHWQPRRRTCWLAADLSWGPPGGPSPPHCRLGVGVPCLFSPMAVLPATTIAISLPEHLPTQPAVPSSSPAAHECPPTLDLALTTPSSSGCCPNCCCAPVLRSPPGLPPPPLPRLPPSRTAAALAGERDVVAAGGL